MLMTGEAYRASLRDGRQVWISGERVQDVSSHPLFKPIVDIHARIYDTAHKDANRPIMTYCDQSIEAFNIGAKLPTSRQDWHAKRAFVERAAGLSERVMDA
jgi:4-hydroxyphenylacetate 3-monooxygenase